LQVFRKCYFAVNKSSHHCKIKVQVTAVARPRNH
jgi:hypothetical protein